MAIFNIFLLSLHPPQQELSHTTRYKRSTFNATRQKAVHLLWRSLS